MFAKPSLPISLVLLVFGVTSARAERPPEPKQEADLIVTGRAGKVYTNTDSADVNYIVEIEVQSTQKGPAVQPGQILDARCFQRRRDAPRVPAAYGHHQVPREGDTIRAYLMRRPDGRYEGTYPDWIDPMGAVPPEGGPPRPEPRYPYWALGVYTQPVQLGDRAACRSTGSTAAAPRSGSVRRPAMSSSRPVASRHDRRRSYSGPSHGRAGR